MAKPARFPGALPPIWNVPHHRNRHYTGRDELLDALHRTLTEGQTALTALSGLGGIGKTQTAVEYAYRHQAEFDLVWWLPAEEPAALLGDYAALAREMKLPEAGERDLPAVAQAVRRALERRGRWLLVFDNARDEAELRELLPRGGGGRVLITSRNPNWDCATPLEVPLLARASAVAFLLKRTGQDDEAAAGALAAELGDLPLALEQAAAFIARRRIALAEYLDLFREQHAELWRREKPPQGYPDTVGTTWILAVARLMEEQPAAVDLLNLCAFLAPEAVPSRLLTDHHEDLPPPLNEAAADSLAWGDLVEALRSYSLVTVGDGSLSFHRLVQAATRDRLAAHERQRWAGAAVTLMNAGFPYEENNPATWAGSRERLAHALAAAGHAEPLAAGIEGTGRLLNDVGRYLSTVAEFDQAKACFERALRIDETALGPDHPDVANRVNNLGEVLWAQDDLAGARAAFERALAIFERALGAEHPRVATAVNNLGEVLRAQDDLAGARAAFERALRIDEAAYGPNHPKVAIRLRNLGELMVLTGERAVAVRHLSRALAVFEKFFAADHRYVLGTRRSLRAAEGAGSGESDRSG